MKKKRLKKRTAEIKRRIDGIKNWLGEVKCMIKILNPKTLNYLILNTQVPRRKACTKLKLYHPKNSGWDDRGNIRRSNQLSIKTQPMKVTKPQITRLQLCIFKITEIALTFLGLSNPNQKYNSNSDR